MKDVAEAGGVGALLSMVLGVPGMAYHVGSRGARKSGKSESQGFALRQSFTAKKSSLTRPEA